MTQTKRAYVRRKPREQDQRCNPEKVRARVFKTTQHERRRELMALAAITPKLTKAEIARRMGVSASAIAKLLGKIEAQGYVPPPVAEAAHG